MLTHATRQPMFSQFLGKVEWWKVISQGLHQPPCILFSTLPATLIFPKHKPNHENILFKPSKTSPLPRTFRIKFKLVSFIPKSLNYLTVTLQLVSLLCFLSSLIKLLFLFLLSGMNFTPAFGHLQCILFREGPLLLPPTSLM